ncbi:MAG: hypothetical protein LBM64_01090 [Deltaproteobacteria bacterium]|jgi:hypothetical protein|nr:hypothetical protein [Deltaproteobacteria bacterium]
MRNRKSILKGGLALLVLFMLTLAGCGSDLNISEEEVVKRAREELALLQPLMTVTADNIKAELGDTAVIYENLSITMRELPGFAIKVDKVVMSGMDIPSYEGTPGDLTDIRSITYSGAKIFMEGQQVGALDSYVLEKVRLPYRDLVQAMKANQGLPGEDFALKMMPYFTGYTAEAATAGGFTFNYMFVQAGIEKMEARDIKLGSYGPSSISKIQVSAMGSKVFSLDKLGCEGMTFPQFFIDFMADPENYLDNNPDMEDRLENDPLAALSPFEIKDFYLDNLYIDAGAPLTLKKYTGDFRLVDGAVTIKSGMQDLSITRALLAQNYELRQLSQAIKQDLLLSGDCNMRMIPNGELFDVDMQTGLKENALGGFSLDMGVIASKNVLFDDDDYYYYDNEEERGPAKKTELLKHMEMSVEDNGIIDMILICYNAVSYNPAGLDGLYRQLFASLDESYAQAETEKEREAIAQTRKLLRDGGKLTLSLKPAQPVDMNQVKDIITASPDSLGYKLDYTPPAVPKARR